ncbi:MAG: DUF2460 domain-containing protein [Novosphingobium sp.]|nr:DUF2460 domain-containing protein [Novosphingobium sp.]
MPFWLADKRTAQTSAFIQRFDPRFWTVDFPRPMMAAATTPAPDALRIDAVFLRRNDLTGIIWESADRWDHPLLRYDTDRDYSHTVLAFRWRSAGVLALDAVNGPTLTIEGRNAAGAPRAWYVRLWNYAQGTSTDAQVELRFSNLAGGFVLPGEADPVHPADIDRMFISLVAPGHDPASAAPLAAPVEGWAELSTIRCEGSRAMLAIGDVMAPPHGVGMATGYDDAYNQTPARLLRTIRGLGYRRSINHYVGMSHFMRLYSDGGGGYAVDPAQPALNIASAAWHRAFFAEAAGRGYSVIASLSYELLAQHCPPAWQQRDIAGDPARTGWVPPSALLSPANGDAMGWVQKVARAFVALQKEAGLPVRFQLGEPWWWVTADGRICCYDDAARTAFGGNPVVITDLRQPLSPAQTALLDQAGASLAQSSAALTAAVRAEAGAAGAEMLLLAYLPTVSDPAMPEAKRANLPLGWADPAFDTLQLEAYDWVTGGAEALHRAGVAEAVARLGYPAARQHYISGFVLGADTGPGWRRIDAAIDEARARGVAETFVWALPQVCRDGFVRLPASPSEDDAMQAFDDVPFPLPLGLDAVVAPEFSTAVTITASGHERRNALWSDARLRFDVGPGVRSEADLGALIAFFRARRGQARGFRLRDPADFSSRGMTGTPAPADQLLGIGDGLAATFALAKRYGAGAEAQVRPITRPAAASVRIALGASEITTGWTLEPGGTIRFAIAPAAGVEVRAGFLFDVPVRFAEDRLDISGAGIAAGEAPSVPLLEIREAA